MPAGYHRITIAFEVDGAAAGRILRTSQFPKELTQLSRRRIAPQVDPPSFRWHCVRADRVVQLSQNLCRFNRIRLRSATDTFTLIGSSRRCKTSPTTQARREDCCLDELQDQFIIHQGLPCPVLTDGTEQSVLDLVPVRCRRREVPHRDRQVELVGKCLAAAVVCHGRDSAVSAMTATSVARPAPDDRHRELRRLPGGANHDVPFVPRDVVDAEGDGPLGKS